MKRFLLVIVSVLITQLTYSQKYSTSIAPYPNLVKADPRLILKTGYLVVPEDRAKPNGAKVKLPFFFVRRADQDAKKNVSLYMTGGPGYSTTANIDSISYTSGFLKYGGFIALDQRGTKRAQPSLDCPEVQEALKRSYREGKNKDSLILLATKECRDKFNLQGINLSAYNTSSSVEDINDLRLALNLDSLNLIGISYSGGLMLSVASRHPEAVKTLILNSPLPGFVNYEEGGLMNINQALEQMFTNCEKDSIGKIAYKDLRKRFHNYFTTITNKKFKINYLEKGSVDSINISYGKKEILDAIIDRLNTSSIKSVPFVINQIINGHHQQYIKEVLDGYFNGDKAVSLGMRYSVYCSEQIAYSSAILARQQEKLLPWLAGYSFNNVNYPICDCWNVVPVAKKFKSPTYANVPALISAGDIDPWCRPYYNQLIKKYFPNSQLLIFHNRGHAAGFVDNGINYIDLFMANPFKKLVPN